MAEVRDHWDQVYATKAETAVSWYQPQAVRSLSLIGAAARDRRTSVIDVGAGASTLVDNLIAKGFEDVTVLDIANTALERSKNRMGGKLTR